MQQKYAMFAQEKPPPENQARGKVEVI